MSMRVQWLEGARLKVRVWLLGCGSWCWPLCSRYFVWTKVKGQKKWGWCEVDNCCWQTSMFIWSSVQDMNIQMGRKQDVIIEVRQYRYPVCQHTHSCFMFTRIVHAKKLKMCNHLLTHVSFATCMAFFLLLKTKEDIWKNIPAALFPYWM